MAHPHNQVDIFIGTPIEWGSEKAFLKAAVAELNRLEISATVFANFELGGRQIDFVVATERSVWVVEVKSSSLPVRGGMNGPWQRLSGTGDWTSYGNAYEQVVGAKNRVRDGMQKHGQINEFYPHASAVFTKRPGSSEELTTGNFKAKVETLTTFLADLGRASANPWSMAQWSGWARSLGLASVSLDGAVSGTTAHDADRLFEIYRSAAIQEYGSGDEWLPETPEQAEDLLSQVNQGPGLHIFGPSGCGKSLVLRWLARELLSRGDTVLCLDAKDFPGNWSDFLNREVALLADRSFSALIGAVRYRESTRFLLFDGVNELAPDQNVLVLRGLKAIARRYEFKLITSSQSDQLDRFGGLSKFQIERPSLGLKQRIANAGNTALPAAGLKFLEVAQSGFEASLVARVGGSLPLDTTRLTLIDQYVRQRVGSKSRQVLLGLRRFSEHLHQRTRFSASEADFDDLMVASGANLQDMGLAFDATVLSRKADRVSFSHEMYQNAFLAFMLAREANDGAVNFGQKLSFARLEGAAPDIVSAIESETLCVAVLENVSSASLLAAAASGELGVVARSAAARIIGATIKSTFAEIEALELDEFEESTTYFPKWVGLEGTGPSTVMRARLGALGALAVNGQYRDDYLKLCRTMDEKVITERRKRLSSSGPERTPSRSGTFMLAYYGFSTPTFFSTVSNIVRSGSSGLPPRNEGPQPELTTLSSGEILFYLENRFRPFPNDRAAFAGQLIKLMSERWKAEPHHVRLCILACARFCNDVSGEIIAKMVAAIDGLYVHGSDWALNNSVIDALKGLGAIDEEAEELRQNIRDEVLEAVKSDPDQTVYDKALNVYTRRFDHPYDHIYYEEIDALAAEAKLRFYRNAFQSSNIGQSMSLSSVAADIAIYDDPRDADLFKRFTALPEASNRMPQEIWAMFALAVRYLARHGVPLPEVLGSTPEINCMREIRTLMYVAQNGQLESAEAKASWESLLQMPPHLVIGCLDELNDMSHSYLEPRNANFPRLHLLDLFPSEILSVARRFVDQSEDRITYTGHRSFWERPGIAFKAIGKYGDRQDISRLQRRSIDPRYAKEALETLKIIEAVAST